MLLDSPSVTHAIRQNSLANQKKDQDSYKETALIKCIIIFSQEDLIREQLLWDFWAQYLKWPLKNKQNQTLHHYNESPVWLSDWGKDVFLLLVATI